MSAAFIVLLAERNRHVREFLRRELVEGGHRVLAAGDGREVLAMLQGPDPPDLLVLDLEMPYLGGLEILAWLREHRPTLPVVIHSFAPENATDPVLQDAAAFVEKSGDNINNFKATIHEVLRRNYPERSGAVPASGSVASEGRTRAP